MAEKKKVKVNFLEVPYIKKAEVANGVYGSRDSTARGMLTNKQSGVKTFLPDELKRLEDIRLDIIDQLQKAGPVPQQ